MATKKKEFIVKDSGQRQNFSTGAVRDIQQGKGRFDLIPTLPIRRLAKHFENGAVKYGDNNWQKGIPLARYLDSLERHVNCLKAGESTEDHLAAIMWNAVCFMWTQDEIEHGFLPRELDNLPLPEAQFRDKVKKDENDPL
jgi:hypothetical protein